MNTWCYLLPIFYFLNLTECVRNNVCPTIEDYYTLPDNPRCWYNFAADSNNNVTDIVSKHGYHVEVHKGITPDGYILSIIRIRSKNGRSNKGPVFMQHGYQASSLSFVAKGKNSLALILAEAGYDVWLGNFRGNEYSEEHVTLTTNDYEYWDYSMDEIGQYDIPTQLKIISDVTGTTGDIVYIGHSLGTTAALIYGSTYPEHAKQNVKLFILLAPAATLSNMISPLKTVLPFFDAFFPWIKNNNLIKLTSQASILKNLVHAVCLKSTFLMELCTEMLNVVYGINSQIDAEMIPVHLYHFPSGSSLKLVTHLSSMASNFFGYYNYASDNILKYGSKLPPQYQVSRMQVPVFIMYSVGDWVCCKADAHILYNSLPAHVKVFGIHEIAETNFNHADFMYGKNAKSLVYDHILNLLDNLL